VGICNESADACQAQPANEGNACDDGLYCTTGETCSSGICGNGNPLSCPPNQPHCDETRNECVECLSNAHCGDDLVCNGIESCISGICLDGTPVSCEGLADACNRAECVEPTGLCELFPEPFGTPCSDGDECTTADRCVSGICTGFLPPHDADCDGFANPIEEMVTCDPNDFYVIPTQATYFGGSRRLKTAAEAMMTWFSPRDRHVYLDSDPACDSAGLCGANGFCERGGIGDPCTIDADCSLPPSTCRMVVNFGNVADMTYRLAKLKAQLVDHLFPISPGCTLKVDLALPDFKRSKRMPLRLVIMGTTDGRLRRDRDAFIFHK
jgi:hypothetical protein